MATTTVPYISSGTTITTITGQTVNRGDILNISSGGTATTTTINSGTVNVSSGGLADKTRVEGKNSNGYRGQLYVSNGGTVTNTTLAGGSMHLVTGGTATGNTIYRGYSSGTYQEPGDLRLSGGTAIDNTVRAGGFLKVWSGTAISNTINSGGVLFLSKGLGIAEHTTINNGGHMSITSGATASDTTVSSGGTMTLAYGTATSTTVETGGSMTIFYGTFTSGLVNNGSVVVGNEGQAKTCSLSADTIDTTNGTFNVYGKTITLTGIPGGTQTDLELTGTITLWGILTSSTSLMNLTARISSGTLAAKGLVVVKDSTIRSNTFTVEDCDSSSLYDTHAELKFTGSNTLNNVDLTLTSIISTTTTTAGMTTVEGTLTVTESTLTTNKWVTNNGTIEMDAKSTITAVSLTNTGTGVIINGSADEFSTYANGNMKKVIDLSSGSKDEKINLDSESSATGLYLVYHEKGYWLADVDQTTMYVNSSYAGSYGDAIAGETKKYFGYNAFNTISDAPSAIDKIELYGAVSYAAYFDNIEGLVDGAALSKNLYGGKKYTGSGAVSGATNLTINSTSGSAQLVCGGSLISNGQSITLDGTNLTINGGTFTNYSVMGADKVTSGTLTNGASVLTINGGTFGDSERDPIAVAGGAMFAGANSDGNMATLASATTTITGGSFADNSWLYGGSISTSKANNSVRTAITGSTKITIDASAGHTIALSNIVAGSYGDGTVGGNAELVFTGTGGALTVSGQIWGGCSGDEFSYDTKAFVDARIATPNLPSALFRKIEGSKVAGSRILSFTGFTGTLDCTKIGAFSDVKLTGSQVTLDSGTTYNFSEVDNWEFDAGSSLTGDFLNNFTDDTLNLTGTLANGTLLTNTNANGFFGFGDLADIQLDGVSQQLTDANYDADTMTWAWSADNHNYSLAVSNGTMQFTIA